MVTSVYQICATRAARREGGVSCAAMQHSPTFSGPMRWLLSIWPGLVAGQKAWGPVRSAHPDYPWAGWVTDHVPLGEGSSLRVVRFAQLINTTRLFQCDVRASLANALRAPATGAPCPVILPARSPKD